MPQNNAIIPPPPSGYSLDSTSASTATSVPPPPSGYSLDNGNSHTNYVVAPSFKPTVSTNVPTTPDFTSTATGLMNSLPFSPDLVDKTVGAIRGIGSTVDSLRRLYSASQGDVTGVMMPKSSLLIPDPNNPAERLGYGAEQAAEYAAGPAAVDARLAKVAGSGIPSMLLRALGSGGANAGVTALHGDTSTPSLATSAALGAAGPVADAAGTFLQATAPVSLLSRALKQTATDSRFGRSAAQGISDAGLVAATRDSLRSKVASALSDLGQQIDAKVSNANAGRIDATSVLKSLDSHMSTAAAAGDETLSKAIAQFKNQIGNNWTLNPYTSDGSLVVTGPKDFTSMSPTDLLQLKRDIDSFTNYNPLLSSALRDAQFGARGAAKDALNAAVPDITPLNKQASNLYAAQDILRRTAPTPDLITAGVLGDMAGHVIGNVATPLAMLNVGRKASRMLGPATGLAALSRTTGNLLPPAATLAVPAYLGTRDAENAEQSQPDALANTFFNMQLLRKVAAGK